MKLLNTLTQDKKGLALSLSKGFTFIELLVAVAILVFIGVIGSIVGIDAYQRYLFRSDLDTIAALLSKARSSAVHSIGLEGIETSHGVHFNEDGFVLFRTESGQAYGDPLRDDSFDLFVEKSKVSNIENGAEEVVFEVVFNPPSGESSDAAVKIINGAQEFVITINPEGGLDW